MRKKSQYLNEVQNGCTHSRIHIVCTMHPNNCQYPLMNYLNVEKVIVNDVIQEKNGNFLEIYDLQGLHLTCISKSFPPFLLIYGCNQNGKNCRTSGGFYICQHTVILPD